MLDPHELYQLTDDLPDLGQPVLIQALTGFVDAGNATRLAREHLLTSPRRRAVATFDVDQLFDYRSRRPVMIFVEDHWEQYDEPTLELHLLHDDDGTPFLLLAGPEPDLQWERFVGRGRRARSTGSTCGSRSGSTRSRWRCRTPGRPG